jgi:hypothetical protein
MPDLCDNCLVDPRRNSWSRECEACARYRKRTGSPRPLYLIERAIQLRSEREGA